MNNKTKRIINIILLIIAAIVTFAFVKSLPKILMQTAEISKVDDTAYAYTEDTMEFIKRCKRAYDRDDISELVVLDVRRLKDYEPDAIEREMLREILGYTSLDTMKAWAEANENDAYNPRAIMTQLNFYYDIYQDNDVDEIKNIDDNIIGNLTYTDYVNLSSELKNSPYTYYSACRIAIKNRTEFEEVKEWMNDNWEENDNTSGGGNQGGGSQGGSGSNVDNPSATNPDESEIEEVTNPSRSSFVATTQNLIQFDYGDGHYWRVIADSVSHQIYCASKGARLSGQGVSYEEVKNRANENPKSAHGCAKEPGHLESYPYYFKTSERKANFYEAFVLTWPGTEDIGWNEWSGIKQEAVWDTPTLSDNRHAPKATLNGVTAEVLAIQAGYYQEFMNKIVANNGTMKIGDRTEQDKVQKNIDYTKKEYTIGPFKIDYINGDYNLVFGGISDMYVIGENTKRIDIKSIILVDPVTGEETETLTNYFVPTGRTMKGTMAQGEQGVTDRGRYNLLDIYPQAYPDPNQEFYIKYVSTSDEKIEKLHIDFEWMEASATITYYNATKYKTSFSHHHETHYHSRPRKR